MRFVWSILLLCVGFGLFAVGGMARRKAPETATMWVLLGLVAVGAGGVYLLLTFFAIIT